MTTNSSKGEDLSALARGIRDVMHHDEYDTWAYALRPAAEALERLAKSDNEGPVTIAPGKPVITPDAVCEHGTALDVHCCNCHGGFMFDAASCVCEFTESATPERSLLDQLAQQTYERLRPVFAEPATAMAILREALLVVAGQAVSAAEERRRVQKRSHAEQPTDLTKVADIFATELAEATKVPVEVARTDFRAATAQARHVLSRGAAEQPTCSTCRFLIGDALVCGNVYVPVRSMKTDTVHSFGCNQHELTSEATGEERLMARVDHVMES